MTRRLVVTADDFGLSRGVNAGVGRAHRDGIVTATSLMVHQPEAEAAAVLAASMPALDVGLHVDLGEWDFVGGEWIARYERVDQLDPDAVAAEIDAQLARFQRLIGRPPTHLDSHQHVHGREPCRRLLVAAAAHLGVPLRHEGAIRYVGEFYGQTTEGESLPELITVEHIVALVEAIPDGVTELCCHPALVADMPGAYRDERVVEAGVLCDPRVRSAVDRAGVRLVGFTAG